MTAIRITGDSTRAELAAAIKALRAKAERYSLHDPRRKEIDVEVDRLVDRVLAIDA